jgi:8-oxo-dGTP pyrophosphatase MutT (NUDIX family)
MLREAVEEAGLDPDSIEVREVDTVESARREEFVGSPTIRVDGHDVQAPVGGEPTGLACRVYRRRDGRTSPLPDPEDLRDALRAATVR